MDPAIRERGEKLRKLPRRTRRADALERGAFGEPQLIHAIGVHGRVSLRCVELSSIDLGNVSQEIGRGGAVLSYKSGEVTKEKGIAEMGQRVLAHESTTFEGSHRCLDIGPGVPFGVLSLYHAHSGRDLERCRKRFRVRGSSFEELT